MSEEHCPECGAKITGKTGFCSECGAVTTSLNNKIKETKENQKIENIQKWYHKPDKSHKMALIYSALLPFSGNLYLRENIINLVLTVISISFILGNIVGLLTISDFYYRYDYLASIYALLWIISMISLIYLISQYQKRDVYYKKDDEKYSRESQLPNLFNNEYIKYIPYVLVLLFLIVSIGVALNDGPKTYDTSDFTLKYPHKYKSDGEWKYNSYYSQNQGKIEGETYKDDIEIIQFYAINPIKNYVDEVVHEKYKYGSDYKNTIKEKITVDDTTAYVIQDKQSEWTNVMFNKNGKLYQIIFNGNSQNDMDSIINSFKTK